MVCHPRLCHYDRRYSVAGDAALNTQKEMDKIHKKEYSSSIKIHKKYSGGGNLAKNPGNPGGLAEAELYLFF